MLLIELSAMSRWSYVREAVGPKKSDGAAMDKDRKASSSHRRQKITVVAVFPETKEGEKAFAALEKAAGELKTVTVRRLPFQKLDFGETAALDLFYSADVAVADVTEKDHQGVYVLASLPLPEAKLTYIFTGGYILYSYVWQVEATCLCSTPLLVCIYSPNSVIACVVLPFPLDVVCIMLLARCNLQTELSNFFFKQ